MRSRNEIMEILGANREGLRRDFGVESMALFGSAARGDAGPLSDVDVLVEIPTPISLFELVALQLRLQELLTVPKVDVVLRDTIFPPLRDAILAEALRVA
jgi:predicted nucleotidyltransferase